MPPFKLEALKYNARDNRVPKMLYCKKEYQQKVKITNWNMIPETQPIDTNPYNPKCFRLHNSHYDRLGNQDDPNLISETHDSLKNGIIRSTAFEQDPHKYAVNFYTYKAVRCQPHEYVTCPKICADEYVSTMQYSYQPPYPCEIKRLVVPAVGNQNKHMANKNECKFLDDNFKNFTKTLQDVKGFRHIAYNPCREMYIDSTNCMTTKNNMHML